MDERKTSGGRIAAGAASSTPVPHRREAPPEEPSVDRRWKLSRYENGPIFVEGPDFSRRTEFGNVAGYVEVVPASDLATAKAERDELAKERRMAESAREAVFQSWRRSEASLQAARERIEELLPFVKGKGSASAVRRARSALAAPKEEGRG